MRSISLTKGMLAVVDDCDYELVSQFTWRAVYEPTTKSWYATANVKTEGKKTTLKMHRLVLGVTDLSVLVDHRNHDTLDNTRSNLRRATQRENQQNQRPRLSSSPYKGVSKSSNPTKPWRAQIRTVFGRRWLGEFESDIEAAKVYDNAAREYHGRFAYLNFPDRDELRHQEVAQLVEG